MNTRGSFAKVLGQIALGGCVLLLIAGMVLGSEYLLRTQESQPAAVSAARVVALTNEERAGENLPSLRVSELLTQAAQLKAEHMAENEYYAHVSPDGKTPLYWLDRVGYRYLNAGENLVIDRTTSEQVVSAWMHSADHRKNILRSQFTEIGVGIAEGRYKGEDTIFVAQVFGTPYPSAPLVREVPKPAPVVRPVEPSKPVTPIRTPDPIPVPAIAPKPAAPTTNKLISQVEALAAPVLESLRLPSSTQATTTPKEPQFGMLEVPPAIELPSAPELISESSNRRPIGEGMREYLKSIGLRIAELWGWSPS